MSHNHRAGHFSFISCSSLLSLCLFWKDWQDIPWEGSLWLHPHALSRKIPQTGMSLGSLSGKRGGNEQHAAWITVGVWTWFSFTLSGFWLLEFDSLLSGFLSVLRAKGTDCILGQQQLRQCSSRSICSAGCVVITLFDFSSFFPSFFLSSLFSWGLLVNCTPTLCQL